MAWWLTRKGLGGRLGGRPQLLRPFLLRRLKADVEKQMPSKTEHVVYCDLSRRQRFLYDEFMGRTKTKETLRAGNYMTVMNILMQLRKVCNHPNLFAEPVVASPFVLEPLQLAVPALACVTVGVGVVDAGV